jgi:hypothetical protein
MIKIPDYIFCFTKFVSFFGLDYEAPSDDNKNDKMVTVHKKTEEGDQKKAYIRKTKKNRIKDRRTFDAQTHLHSLYIDKTIELLTEKNELDKQDVVKAYFMMSEDLVRFLTSKNYYTIASDKRASWALLVFFYIPHIACIIGSHQKKFGLPDELIEHDFMFPYRDLKSGTVITPNKRFYKYCNYFMRYIDEKEGSSILKFLYYLDELNKKSTIPGFDKKRQILEEIAEVDLFKSKIPEVDILFYAVIVSGNIYNELKNSFGEIHALELFDYFKVCMGMQEQHLNDDFIDYSNRFKMYFSLYMSFFEMDCIRTLKLLNAANEPDYDLEEVEGSRDQFLTILLNNFDAFLHATNTETQNQLDEINIDGKKGVFRDYIYDELELDHENLISILMELEDIFTAYWELSWIALEEPYVAQLLQSLKTNKFYSNYEYEYLYYDALNEFAKNNFDSAQKKLLAIDKNFSDIRAGDTWHDIAVYLIILKLINSDTEVRFSHLNPLIKLWIEAQADQCFYQHYSDKPKEKSNQDYFDEIHLIMSDFNRIGYARYKDTPCIKYTPYQKLDNFIGDFYALDETINVDVAIGETLVKPTLESLMLGSKAKYGINSYFVVLFEFKAVHIFEPQNYKKAVSFYECSEMHSENISRLAQDEQKLKQIYEAIKEMSNHLPEKK